MKKRIFIISILVLSVKSSCNSDPKSKYLQKKKIGMCSESEGMVTFEVYLYSDSTFYQPDNDLIGYSYGTFRRSKKSIRFITQGGKNNLCDDYIFDTKLNAYYSADKCPGDPLHITWDNL